MREFWVALGVVLLSLCAGAIERGVNLIPDPGFETGGAWESLSGASAPTLDDTVAHSGKHSLRLEGKSLDDAQGAHLTITLDPPVQHPLRVAGWSRAQNAEVGKDYNLYLDLHYADGTPLWGVKAEFEPGTHDWEHAEFVFDVAKPVKTIDVYAMFRKAKGLVWFDDIEVTLARFAFSDIRVLPGLFGSGVGVSASANLPCSWRIAAETAAGPAGEARGDRLPMQLLLPGTLPPQYTIRIAARDDLLSETITHEQQVTVVAAEAAPPRHYAVWTESSMRRVMPGSLPEKLPVAPDAAIALAGHEYESFQLVVLPAPGRPLSEVTVDISDLVCAETGARIAKENTEWHQVGYVRLDRLQPHPAEPGAAPGWWPDALLPVSSFSVQPGFAQAVWVTVYAPPNTPMGRYAGAVTIRPRNEPPTACCVQATVYGFNLPVRGHIKTAFALMDGFLERVYGKPLDSGLRQAYGDYVLRHRLNPDDISRTAPPAIDDLLRYRDRGLNAFNVLNMVEDRGDRPWVCWSPLSVYTAEFKQRIIQQLEPFVDELRKYSLADMAYIHTFDERGPEFRPVMREYFGLVKERYPEVHTLTTSYIPPDLDLLRDLHVDWICPLTPAYQYDAAERCRAAGHQVWSYIALDPRYPYANWLCDHPLVEARVIWWQAFQQKMDGFLYWGLNIWNLPHNDRPIDPAQGPLLDWSITTGGECNWLQGDGRLLYAGKNGPVGSIRLANIRDGLEDYEYLWLLNRGRDVCRPVSEDLTHFTRDPAVVYNRRNEIARQIEETWDARSGA